SGSAGKSRPVLHVARSADSPSSASPARDPLQRTPTYRVPRRATPSACTGKAWPQKCEGRYENHVYRGKTEGFLGRARIFLLRRDLGSCCADDRSTTPSKKVIRRD